jgi:histidinol dehydrogenase
MRIVNGFNEARLILARQVNTDIPELSSRLKESLKVLFDTEDAEEAVRIIVSEVQHSGDLALLSFTSRIDGVELKSLEVPGEEIIAAVAKISPEILAALQLAAARVREFHRIQMDAVIAGSEKMKPGTVMRILERVGVYVPGGTASYPSSVLMTVIPARVAGVKEIIMATPPGKDGHVPVLTLAAAHLAGVDKIFAVGGAQAIAAMAYGTATLPKVDKICGPGNIFVMLAKKLVYGAVDIDGLQGPSEVLIIADGTGNASYCAADMLAQAEHDTLAQSILITTSPELAQSVVKQIDTQLNQLERQVIMRESLEKRGLIVVVEDIKQAIELSNLYAPEHLCLIMADSEKHIDSIDHAGCVFIGYRPTVVMGDYVAGPSHALPTSGTARFSSPLNVTDFIKYINIVNVERRIWRDLGAAASTLAKAEGFNAHARAVQMRLE